MTEPNEHDVLGFGTTLSGRCVVCENGGIETATDLVKTLIDAIAGEERARGIKIDWEAELYKVKKDSYTSREVVNAMGRALTAAGVPNNLERNA